VGEKLAELRFDAGEAVYVRYFQRETVAGLYPYLVVRHDDDGLLAYTPKGSRNWFPFLPDGRQLRGTPLPEWFASRWVWAPWEVPRPVLSWFMPAEPLAVQLLFDSQGRFASYYGNLQAPVVLWRDVDGRPVVDSEDWDLDVLIDEDLTWRLKDADELVERARWPDLYWVDPEQAHAAARRVVELIDARHPVFDAGWRDFAPDPLWSPIVSPALPEGWDRARVR
jgi:hypothetical protein